MMSPGVVWRLIDLTGLSQTYFQPSGALAEVAFFVLLCMFALSLRRRVDHELVDVYLFLAAAISVCGLLAAPAFDTYYGYFAAPFLLGLLAVSLSRLGALARRLANRVRISTPVRRLVSWSSLVAGFVLITVLAWGETTFYLSYASGEGINGPSLSAVAKVIPPDPALSMRTYSRVCIQTA